MLFLGVLERRLRAGNWFSGTSLFLGREQMCSLTGCSQCGHQAAKHHQGFQEVPQEAPGTVARKPERSEPVKTQDPRANADRPIYGRNTGEVKRRRHCTDQRHQTLLAFPGVGLHLGPVLPGVLGDSLSFLCFLGSLSKGKSP